jgi:hypothetical protein
MRVGFIGLGMIVTSLKRATSVGVPPSVAPAATAVSIGARLRDVTLTS